MIRRDHHGTLRVPDGAELLEVLHNDPYRWTATLRVREDTNRVWERLVENLRSLRFRVDDRMTASPVATCHEGALRADGTGDCSFNVNLDAGGGQLYVTIRRQEANAPGTITLKREFEHRMPNDPIGPPYPVEPPDPDGDYRGAEEFFRTSTSTSAP